MRPYLNSILLEGQLLTDPVLAEARAASSTSDPAQQPSCSFTLASGSDAPAVPVIAYGRLGLHCTELLHEGSYVRLVGHIAQDTEASTATHSFRLHLVLEHVELQPSPIHASSIEESANVG